MFNRNLFKKAAGRAITATALVLALSYCTVDERYSFENIKNVNTDVTLFENGLSVPLVESTAKITIDSLVRASGLDTTAFGDYLKVAGDGSYYISYETTLSLDEAIADLDLKNLVKVDAIEYSQDVSYSLGDISSSSLKTPAETIEYASDIESFNLDLNLEPLSETINFLSADYLHTAAAAAKLAGESSFTLPAELSVEQNSSQNLPAFTLPQQIKSLESATLKPGAAIVVEFIAEDPIFSAGSIVPDIKVDLSDVLVLADGTSILDISTLTLNNGNGYSAKASFGLKALVTGKFDQEKTIPFAGTIRQDGLTLEVSKAEANTRGLNVAINVSFVNVELDEITGIIGQYSMDCKVEANEISYTMPEGLGNFGTFTVKPKGTPVITVNIDIPDLDGLNVQTEGITVHVPEFVKFENVPSELAYDETASAFTITSIKKGTWTIPVKGLEVTPKKVGDNYVIEGYYSADGVISIPEGRADLSKLLAISGQHVGIRVEIPEIEAESIALSELSIDVDENTDFNLIAANDIPDMIGSVGRIELKDVDATMEIQLNNLPDIGNGKFLLDLNVSLPDFIRPSEIKINEDITNGKLARTVHIEGLDLSEYDLAAMKAEGKDLAGSIRFAGKVSAENPTVDLSSLNTDISGSIIVRIADANNNIEISKLSAKVDYQLDTLFKYPFFALPEELKDCVLDLPDVSLEARISSNLAMPLDVTLSLKDVVENLPVEFPYSENPEETKTVVNTFSLDLDSVLQNNIDSLELHFSGNVDKTRDVIVYPDAEYHLGLDIALNAPLELGENTNIVYADTVDLAENGKILAEVLETTKARLYGSIENTMPFSVNVKIELLAYDEAADEYRVVETEVPAEAVLAKAGETNDFTLVLAKAENASTEGLSHIRFSVGLSANGSTAKPEDYIQISKLGFTVPEGISLNISEIASK